MAKLVNWYIFESKIKEKNLTIFTPFDIRRIFGSSKIAITFLLHRYTKKGFIIHLRRGLYALRDIKIPDLYLANKLYEPSYVSLEFALSYHRVIPETVYTITSITPKASRQFKVSEKLFTYQNIKKVAFRGYTTGRQRELTFLIAEPEKALVDLDYFRLINKQKPLSRFNKEKINASKALRYAKLFNNNKLISIIKTTLK